MDAGVESLLNEMGPICTQLRRQEELSRTKGELFNIFSLLEIERKEATHSRLLAALLNPKDLHGLNDAFLRLFLKHFDIEAFDSRTATAQVEWPIGNKTDDSGGRIDIIISDAAENIIVIENKVDAGDQPHQLLRYHKTYPNAPLFYLTLYGTKPSKESTGSENDQEGDNWYECISYERHILLWLEACKIEADNFPIVRDIIIQYINLIKKLTGQPMNSNMSSHIADTVLNSPLVLSTYFDLRRAYYDVFKKIYEKFWRNCAEVAERHHLYLDPPSIYPTTWSNFTFRNEAMEQCGVNINIAFQSQDPPEPLFGFGYVNRWKTSKTPLSLKTNFCDTFHKLGLGVYYDPKVDSGSWWACHARWTGLTCKHIYFENALPDIDDKVEKMLKIIGTVDSKQLS